MQDVVVEIMDVVGLDAVTVIKSESGTEYMTLIELVVIL